MLLEHDVIEPQITEHVAELRDVDGCEKLWRAVIEQAFIDLRYLQRFEGRAGKKHQRNKLHRINANPPGEFLEGAWFEELCEYLRIDPERVRRLCVLLDINGVMAPTSAYS